jgi:hypothetical protein
MCTIVLLVGGGGLAHLPALGFLIKLFPSSCQSQSWEQINYRKRLQEKYNVVIGYDTVWHGKEKVMAELYGT